MLGTGTNQGGVSSVTPRNLAIPLQSLPPTLNRFIPAPIPSCSKAARGLFVLQKIDGIFTAHAISPSSSLRQSPDRYSIRAGRNLPDKEFRYLRTIIVIAGVHWRLKQRLAPPPLTFQHWPGVAPYTSPCGLAESCVFGKQSPGVFRCGSDKVRAGLIPKLRPLYCRVP